MDWTIFRFLADLSHTLSKLILIWAIHWNKSAEGVSLITQAFYLLVFFARYLPLPFWIHGDTTAFQNLWNLTLKIFYIVSSAYILLIMTRFYARTREREKAWKIGIGCLAGPLLTSPFVMLIFRSEYRFTEWLWIFSIELESVCVLPQLLLLRQTTVPTVIDSYYLVALGSYRALYLVNWLVQAIQKEGLDPIAVIFGLIQTALYVDFAWVYFTRQRVKLRGGAIVDSDDLSRGWLVKRIIGNRASADAEGDEESATPFNHHNGGVNGGRPRSGGRWGPRGISVSADDGTMEVDNESQGPAPLSDPQEFEDDLSDGEATHGNGQAPKVGDGSEWRDDVGR